MPGRSPDDVRRLARLPAPGRQPGARPYEPPAYEQLEAQGRVGESWEHYARDDHRLAERARQLGLFTRSVKPAEQRYQRSPDAVVQGARVTVEFKELDSPRTNAMRKRQ